MTDLLRHISSSTFNGNYVISPCMLFKMSKFYHFISQHYCIYVKVCGYDSCFCYLGSCCCCCVVVVLQCESMNVDNPRINRSCMEMLGKLIEEFARIEESDPQ